MPQPASAGTTRVSRDLCSRGFRRMVRRGAAAGLAIQFDGGDAQQLLYDDALFKVCCKRPTNME